MAKRGKRAPSLQGGAWGLMMPATEAEAAYPAGFPPVPAGAF